MHDLVTSRLVRSQAHSPELHSQNLEAEPSNAVRAPGSSSYHMLAFKRVPDVVATVHDKLAEFDDDALRSTSYGGMQQGVSHGRGEALKAIRELKGPLARAQGPPACAPDSMVLHDGSLRSWLPSHLQVQGLLPVSQSATRLTYDVHDVAGQARANGIPLPLAATLAATWQQGKRRS